MTGFTNVVWQARPTEQLATDLVTGAGAGPLTDAALGWSQVSAVLADAGIDYVRILARLGLSWESVTSDQAFGKLGAFAPWFADAAAVAADNAQRAGAQSAAVTVARMTMPNLPEVELTTGIRDAAAAVGAALGAPIGGVAADAERALHDQKRRAARVMETYEAASEPVARPWPGPSPAEVVSSVALVSEQASLAPATRVTPQPIPAVPSSPSGGGYGPMTVGAVAPREKSRFAATVLAGSTAAPVGTESPNTGAGPKPVTPVPPMTPVAGAVASQGEVPGRPSHSTPKAGIDDPDTSAPQTMAGWGHHDQSADSAVDHPDPRYRSGVLNLPPATAVPSVLGAPDEIR